MTKKELSDEVKRYNVCRHLRTARENSILFGAMFIGLALIIIAVSVGAISVNGIPAEPNARAVTVTGDFGSVTHVDINVVNQWTAYLRNANSIMFGFGLLLASLLMCSSGIIWLKDDIEYIEEQFDILEGKEA